MKRVFLIVLDSLGCGEEPDACYFGDHDCNTLKRISGSKYFTFNCVKTLGMGNIDGQDYLPKEKNPKASVCRLREVSLGKDTTLGHWEIAGTITDSHLPVYPNGFPDEIIKEFERQTGRKTLCNLPYSGTQVLDDYGEEHIKTGKLIVYTSADSVFQIAANEDIVPVETLYEYCKIARNILTGEHAVGRVIARPFVGKEKGHFVRTSNRHDFSLEPFKETLLDALKKEGKTVYAVGKINDIFAGRGVTEKVHTSGNTDGLRVSLEALDKDFEGLCFINLVDFDSKYGHRQDVDGYAKAFAEFDAWLPSFIDKMRDDDILMFTADHGCDPGDDHTDHTREYIPLVTYGKNIKPVNLGTRRGFCDIAATIADYLGSKYRGDGESFLDEIIKPTEIEKKLIKEAQNAMMYAYAPYSLHTVGAALLTKEGKIFRGCNIESATHTPTSCAERTALFKAVSEGYKDFEMLAVCGGKEYKLARYYPPCGVCRQALSEFCKPDMPVLLIESKTKFKKVYFKDLLPYSFTGKNLIK